MKIKALVHAAKKAAPVAISILSGLSLGAALYSAKAKVKAIKESPTREEIINGKEG